MEQISFGVFDHIERTSGSANLHTLYHERLRMMEEYDKAGMFAVHIAQHHATPLGMAPSPNVFLAAAAEHTKKLHFGPLVYLLPFYQPLRLIEEICMLDHLSGGRLEVGVGRGVSPFELGLHRIPFYDSRNIYNEGLEVLRRGLSNDHLTFNGKYYQFENVPMELRPLQQPHPDFWYGTINVESTIYAAKHGMHVVTLGPASDAAKVVAAYREAWDPKGPDNLNPHVKSPKIGVQRHIFVAESDAEAYRIGKEAFKVFFHNIQKIWADFHTSTSVFPNDFDLMLKAGAFIVGSPSKVRDELARVAEVTRTNYLVQVFSWGNLTLDQSLGSLNLFASKVMPDLQKIALAA
ncbi:MAG: LLM class flavin-dependent oxidoreductase [Candidatus Binataceae bacterium]|nr:LLM class flavin-dependent oxidoreductase [Candidatus Binataceae bacterium]